VRDSLAVFRTRHALQAVDVGGTVWRYVSTGAGEDTVLFLHGMGGAYDIWWQQIEALAGEHRVIAVSYPPVPTLDRLAAGVEAVLHAEGATAAHVVGTSLGGYLAQYLLARRPARVASAVFANTFPPTGVLRREHGQRAALAAGLPAWAVMRSFAAGIRDTIVPAAGGSRLVEAYLLEQAYGRLTKADFVARYRCVLDDFTAPDPAPAGVPLALLEADNDPLVSDVLRGMLRATYPEAELVTLSGVGHFPYLNEPAAYTATLRRLLARARAARSV
jgi:maspardin